MRRAHIISIIITLFFFEGCGHSVSNIVKKVNSKKENLISIRASKNSEFFIAVLQESINEKPSQTFVRIDSDGVLHKILTLNNFFADAQAVTLNDSILLLGSYRKYSTKGAERNWVFCFNLNTKCKVDSIPAQDIRFSSKDGEYFVVQDTSVPGKDYGEYKPSYHIYRFEQNTIKRSGYMLDPLYPFLTISDHQFVVSDSRWFPKVFDIMNPDMSKVGSFQVKMGVYTINSAYTNHSISFIPISWDTKKEIIEYDLKSKISDTLFTGFYFDHVDRIPNSENYLLGALTEDEFNIEWKEIYKRSPYYGTWEYVETESPHSYSAIGNSKSNQIKFVGFRGYGPTLSSSGRHILFYKQDGYDYRMKVVSVKELVEGG
jgi:hypothetical protein